MGAPDVQSWPRGLPVDDVINKESSSAHLKEITISRQLISVLSDRQPDADELYQALMPALIFHSKGIL